MWRNNGHSWAELSASVTENRPSTKNVMKSKSQLSSSHSMCSEGSMCIDNKYHKSLANGSLFVIKLGQVWRQVIKDN